MKIKIDISCSGIAFGKDHRTAAREAAMVLAKAIGRLEKDGIKPSAFYLTDSNGIGAGTCIVTEAD